MSTHFTLALKSADLVVREYVKNLETQNTKIQKEVAKLECANMSYKNKVAALQRELNKYLKKGHVTVYVNRDGVKTKV